MDVHASSHAQAGSAAVPVRVVPCHRVDRQSALLAARLSDPPCRLACQTHVRIANLQCLVSSIDYANVNIIYLSSKGMRLYNWGWVGSNLNNSISTYAGALMEYGQTETNTCTRGVDPARGQGELEPHYRYSDYGATPTNLYLLSLEEEARSER